MILTTRSKIAIARTLNRVVLWSRSVAGLGRQAKVRRGGLLWDLDLNEGIDLSIYVLGSFEPGTVRALARLVSPGNTVLDIGANMGAHTLPLAKHVGPQGRIIAFEPTDFAYAKLLANIALNPALSSRIVTEQIILAEKSNTTPVKEFYSSWPLESDPQLHQLHGGRLKSASGARAESLDDYLKRTRVKRVDLIKLDVDGHELPVLKGSLECLREFCPTIVMEVSPYVHDEENYSFEELIELLRSRSYVFRDADSGRVVPNEASPLRKAIPVGGSINVIASSARGS